MQADVVIIGGGIAGVSAAYFLSKYTSVVLLEREASLGTQSTGRTAEQFTVGIAAETMRRLGAASRSFLSDPPPGFSDSSLYSRRGCLTVGREDQLQRIEIIRGRLASVGAKAPLVSRDEALRLFPALRPEGVAGGVYEPDAGDIDANALLQAYARGAAARGCGFVTAAEVTGLSRHAGLWTVRTREGAFAAPRVLNASGAWVDEVTRLAGLEPIGLIPMRRTAFTFAAPAGLDLSDWPHVSNIDYRWYLKPETGRFMGSLADEVPTPPSDVFPDDLDVAQAIHNVEQDTTLQVGRPLSTWAGLRNFVADRNPVCGGRGDAEGFFWLAGHGGCGVLSSPALGEAAAAIVLGRDLPPHLRAFGVTAEALAPDRPSLAAARPPVGASPLNA